MYRYVYWKTRHKYRRRIDTHHDIQLKYNTKSYTCMIVFESPTSPPSPTVSVSYPSSKSNSSKLIWITCEGKKVAELVAELFVMNATRINEAPWPLGFLHTLSVTDNEKRSFHTILIKLLGTTDIIKYKWYTLLPINMIFMISPGPALDCSICCLYICARPLRPRCYNWEIQQGNASIIQQIIRTVQWMLRVKQISESAFNQRLTLASKQWSDVLRLFHVIKRSLY